jgi:hypothetical protein
MPRTSGLTPTVAEYLTQVWPDAKLTTVRIGHMLQVSDRTISEWGRQLRLGPKPTTGYHNMTACRKAHREYYARKAAEEAERAAVPMATCEEQPICFVCHGRAQSWDGHDACRGRRAA